MSRFLIPAAVLLPAVAALLSVLVRGIWDNRRTKKIFLGCELCLEFALVLAACVWGGAFEWKLTEGLSIFYRADALARFYALLVSSMWLMVGIYSFEYMEHEERENGFYRFFMMVEGMLVGVAFAGNYMTLYMMFECNTFMSFPLVLNSHTKASVNAAFKYLFYSVCGAALGLLALFVLSVYTNTTVFTAGGTLDMSRVSGHETLILIMALLAILGFGTKAGMFPMHGWLPTAHPEAPSPASAAMSGVITKAGVVAIIRVVFFIIGADFIRGTWVQYTWMTLAMITVFMGSMLAFMEKGLKKRLAYSSVSQISYILLGLSTLTATGLTGGLLHLVFHSVIKDLLFMCAGAVIIRTGFKRTDQLRGLGKSMPWTFGCFTVASLGLVGIPPTGGFVSKWFIAQGALGSGTGVYSWLAPAVLLASALLTAGYLFTISIDAFLPGADFDYSTVQKKELHALTLAPMVLLALLTVLLGIFVTPLQTYFAQIASALIGGGV